MKEITRIHIAKVAYDIELDAKKDIQSYIQALERYADDPELLGDIEIRITELLAERGVVAGGVIAASDVAAVRAQLGEPSDFAAEDAEVPTEDESRRVYRDESDAIVGGVLAGFAKFFGIDTLWVRLIFVVLLFASFGTAIIVYLILWLIIPPAQTATEKLRMSGQPVTLASIKALGEQAKPAVSEAARIMRTLLRMGAGVLLVLGAAGAVVAVVAVTGGTLAWNDGTLADWGLMDRWWVIAGLAFSALAGLLLAALCLVLAVATFRSHWSRRIGTAAVAISIAGILAFSGGVGAVWYGTWQDRANVNALMQTSRADLPSTFSSVKTLKIESSDRTQDLAQVRYVVSNTSHWELRALPGIEPQVMVAHDGTSATLKLVRADNRQTLRGIDHIVQPELTVYGPALQSLEVRDMMYVSYSNNQPQATLDLSLQNTDFSLLPGTYDTVAVTGGFADLQIATINSLVVKSKDGRGIEAGVVRSLAVTQPDACPSSALFPGPSEVRVEAVSSGVLTYNGQEQPAKTLRGVCGNVIIGSDDSEVE